MVTRAYICRNAGVESNLFSVDLVPQQKPHQMGALFLSIHGMLWFRSLPTLTPPQGIPRQGTQPRGMMGIGEASQVAAGVVVAGLPRPLKGGRAQVGER